METVIIAIISIFASGGFWSFIQYQISKKDHDRSALQAGVLSLLHNRLYDLATACIRRNGITAGELDELENLYRPYKELGGNGTGCQLYERCRALPIVSDIESV